MNEKEILKLAVWGIKEQIRKKCVWIADGADFGKKTLDEMRSLIEKFDELNEKLENDCSK